MREKENKKIEKEKKELLTISSSRLLALSDQRGGFEEYFDSQLDIDVDFYRLMLCQFLLSCENLN